MNNVKILPFNCKVLDCKEVNRVVSDYIDGDLQPDETIEFETHLESCKECSKLVSEVKNLVNIAKSLNTNRLPEEIRLRLRQILMKKVDFDSGFVSKSGGSCNKKPKKGQEHSKLFVVRK